MQKHQPIAFHSQVLKGTALALSTYEKEFLALISVVRKWRPYLVGRPFIIKTDQQSLKYLLHQRIGTPLQQKWLSKLMGYAFVVEYKKGSENVVADALSRRGEVTVSEVAPDSHDEFEGTATLHMLRSGQIMEEGKGKMAAALSTA